MEYLFVGLTASLYRIWVWGYSTRQHGCIANWVCLVLFQGDYLVDCPENYDKQRNSSDENEVHRQHQRIECDRWTLLAVTVGWWKRAQSKTPCTGLPSSKSHNHRQGRQNKSRNHHWDVNILYTMCTFKRLCMEGELYPPKERHDMEEPPHSNLKHSIVEHNSYRIKITAMNGVQLFYILNNQRHTDLTAYKKMLTGLRQSNTLKHSTMIFCQYVK